MMINLEMLIGGRNQRVSRFLITSLLDRKLSINCFANGITILVSVCLGCSLLAQSKDINENKRFVSAC